MWTSLLPVRHACLVLKLVTALIQRNKRHTSFMSRLIVENVSHVHIFSKYLFKYNHVNDIIFFSKFL